MKRSIRVNRIASETFLLLSSEFRRQYCDDVTQLQDAWGGERGWGVGSGGGGGGLRLGTTHGLI